MGGDTFYDFLARHGRELFPGEEFAAIYSDDFVRPPGMPAVALVQQLRARRISHERARSSFERSLQLARETALFKGRTSRLPMDNTEAA